MIGPRKVFSSEISVSLSVSISAHLPSHLFLETNKIAHTLAALGSNGQELQRLWLEAVPDDVSVLLASDRAAPV